MTKRVQKTLNPDTKGLPRKDFEYLYPEQKFVKGKLRRGPGPAGPTGPTGSIKSKGRKMKMQQKMKPYKRNEGGLLSKAKKFLDSGTKPKDVRGRGGAGSITGRQMPPEKSVKEKKAAKTKAMYDKHTTKAGMSTEGNISKAGKQGKSQEKGKRFGAAPKVQFPKTTGSYKIKSGDTLAGIAKARGTTVAKIMAANPGIKDKNKIRAGAGLKGVPGLQGSSTTKNIADAGKKRKADPVNTKYGELYKDKGKGKSKTTAKKKTLRRSIFGFLKPTEKQIARRKQQLGKAEGGMASMDKYIKDLL